MESACTLRTKTFCVTAEASDERLNNCGKTILAKRTAKKTTSTMRMIDRQIGRGPDVVFARETSSLVGTIVVESTGDDAFSTGATVSCFTRNHGNFSSSFTETIATVAAQSVARSAVPTIAVGRCDPAATRIAI